MLLLQALLGLVGLVQVTSAEGNLDSFVLRDSYALLSARIDPIINPGKVAGHVHNIFGASNIRSQLNQYATTQEAACTSLIIPTDRSNYWAPLFYYIHDDGKLEALTYGARIYYFTAGKAEPFPPGFRMITGTAMARDMNAIQTRGVSIGCENANDGQIPNGFTHDSCKWASAHITFPSCGWANRSIDSWDHFSHVTWPVGDDLRGGDCPESHPIKYPAIAWETYVNFDDSHPFRKGRHNLVLSNGDLTGRSYHADFVNGWDQDVLTNALRNCYTGDMPDHSPLSACGNFKMGRVNNAEDENQRFEDAQHCTYQGMIPDEDIGLLQPIDKLPGCNPLWPAEVEKKPTCETPPAEPGWVAPNLMYGHSWMTHLPVAVHDVTDVSKMVAKDGKDGKYVGVWGDHGWNSDKIMKPSNSPHLDAPADVDSVFGMTDKTPFDKEHKEAGTLTGAAAPLTVGSLAAAPPNEKPEVPAMGVKLAKPVAEGTVRHAGHDEKAGNSTLAASPYGNGTVAVPPAGNSTVMAATPAANGTAGSGSTGAAGRKQCKRSWRSRLRRSHRQ